MPEEYTKIQASLKKAGFFLLLFVAFTVAFTIEAVTKSTYLLPYSAAFYMILGAMFGGIGTYVYFMKEINAG